MKTFFWGRKMTTVFTNGKIAVTKCMIFGLTVLSEDGNWLPINQLSKEDFSLVEKLIDNNPTFPWKEELNQIREALKVA